MTQRNTTELSKAVSSFQNQSSLGPKNSSNRSALFQRLLLFCVVFNSNVKYIAGKSIK